MQFPLPDGISGWANPRPYTRRGRPRIHNDRKAYKAAKQREYRQRKAAEKEAGK